MKHLNEKPGRNTGRHNRKMDGIWKLLVQTGKDKTGSSVPLIVAVTLCMLFIILGISEYMRLMIIASGVKDAMQSVVISTINDNYNEVYHAVREGYAAGYEPSGESFAASVDYGDIYGRLDYLLGLQESGSYHCKIIRNQEMEFRISGLSVNLPNTLIAPSSGGGTYYADAQVYLEVPMRFAGKVLPSMAVTIRTKAVYREKF